jgi:HK97 family phage major capsid protein/HK97 family phage prohead protease
LPNPPAAAGRYGERKTARLSIRKRRGGRAVASSTDPTDQPQEGAMDRAYSVLTVKKVDPEQRIITGTATTPAPDRMGDIVEPLGVEFKNPMPLLHQHNTEEPVGTVRFDKPTAGGITFTAKMPQIDAPGPLRDRVETAWEEVKAGLVRAVSIGFRPLEYSRMEDGGIRYIRSEVLELSLVTIPAQQAATIDAIKSLDLAQLAASGRSTAGDRPTPPASRTSSIVVKVREDRKMKRTFTEQIAAFEATRAAKSAEMDAIMDAVAEKGETLDTEQKEKYDTLEAEVKEIDEHLIRLRAAEERNKQQARVVEGASPRAAAESRQHQVIAVRPALEKGIGFVRLLGARYLARQSGVSPADIALSKGWGDDLAAILRNPMLADPVTRAAVNPGTTTDPAWAGPLVYLQNLTAEFVELLYAATVVARIPGLTRVPFNIRVPRETTGAAAAWVGEGKPKPVSAMAFDSVSLTFNKVAGIVPITVELMRFSAPSAELVIRNSLVKAIGALVDTTFLDPTKAAVAGVSPASVTNGVTAIPSTGTTPEALRNDLATLIATYAAANMNIDGLVLIMRNALAVAISMARNALGQREFPEMTKDGGMLEGIPVLCSQSVPSGLIVAVNAPDILLADDGDVAIDVSTEASLQMDSAPDSPPVATTVMVSLWQANMVGIKAERFITWLKARSGSVQYISGITVVPGFDEAALQERLRHDEEVFRAANSQGGQTTTGQRPSR